MHRYLLAALLAMPVVALAQAPTPISAASPAAASPAEKAVAARLAEKYPNLSVVGVTRLAVGSSVLFEFQAEGMTGYTNDAVDFVLVGGELIAGAGKDAVNLTRQRAADTGAKLFASFPVDRALRYVYGKGERKLIIFSDPECPFCHELEAAIAARGDEMNATVFIFPYPLPTTHPNARAKAEYIWCTADPAAAWKEWMLSAKNAGADAMQGWDAFAARHPAQVGCPAASNVADALAIGRTLGFSSTPTLVFENGMGWPGGLSMKELEQAFDLVRQMSAPSR